MAKAGSISIAQGTQENINNRTYITVTGVITTSGESYRGNHNTGVVTITQNGVAIHSSTFTHGAPANSTTTLFAIGLWVYHDSNGNSGTITASYNYASSWCSASTSVVLKQISRYATISDATNFNDEENPVITYNNQGGYRVNTWLEINPTNTHLCIRENIETGGSYTYILTDEERQELRKCCTKNSVIVRFGMYSYDGDTLIGTDYKDRTFTIINGTPTLEPTVTDVNETTIALTGDENILVRNFSNALIDSGAQVYKDAMIKNQKVICGNKSLDDGSGTIENIGSGAFIFSLTDSRENVVNQTVNIPLIEYINLTCNLNANAPDAEGDMAFSVSGNCFSGSFGAVENVVTVYYRYKANSDEYVDWIEAGEAELGDNAYSLEVNLSGLDYQKKYTFQAMAIDALMEISSIERVVKTTPVFDWGENDFNFNVPVTIMGTEIKKEIEHIQGNIGTDFIVEQGTSEDWYYRKWNSGKAELWGSHEVKNIACSKAWGTLYETEVLQLPNFPFSFIETPLTQYTWSGGVAAFIEWAIPTKTGAGTTYLARPDNLYSLNGNISMYFVGRWK